MKMVSLCVQTKKVVHCVERLCLIFMDFTFSHVTSIRATFYGKLSPSDDPAGYLPVYVSVTVLILSVCSSL